MTGPHVCACERAASCLVPAVGKRRMARPGRGAATWLLPGAGLLLLPKCPMCVAAYLAIGGCLGVSLTTAAHLRTALLFLCWGSVLLAAARLLIRQRSRRVSVRR